MEDNMNKDLMADLALKELLGKTHANSSRKTH